MGLGIDFWSKIVGCKKVNGRVRLESKSLAMFEPPQHGSAFTFQSS
jgi:hypothetical protein